MKISIFLCKHTGYFPPRFAILLKILLFLMHIGEEIIDFEFTTTVPIVIITPMSKSLISIITRTPYFPEIQTSPKQLTACKVRELIWTRGFEYEKNKALFSTVSSA
jgi:hypothetical protein